MMNWLRSFFDGLSGLVQQGRLDADTQEEFRFHLDMEIASNVKAGMSPAEARRQAHLAFGSTDWHTERVRDEGSSHIMEDLLRDLRFGARALRKRPVFAAAGIITLSLGVGMSTTMFTLVDSVILRPLPGTNTEGMVYLERESEDGTFTSSPSAQLLSILKENSSSFRRIEAYSTAPHDLSIAGEPFRLNGATTSAGFFEFLGVSPQLGIGFRPGDGQGLSSPVVMLSNILWQERFGGGRDALGQTMVIEGQTHEVVGVLPSDFRVDARRPIDFWIPVAAAGDLPAEGAPVSSAIAKLAEGVSKEAAQDELDALIRNNPLDRAARFGFVGRIHTPLDLVDPDLKKAILILQVCALLVLLIGCGNLANLLLAQGESRAREMALRASLGARRGRLIRQLLVESLVLGAVGGVGGILVTTWALDTLPVFLPPGYSAFTADGAVLFSAMGLSVFTVLLSGMLPALKGSRRDLNSVIKAGAGSPSGMRKHRLLPRIEARQFLVATEVAMAFVLLVSASLLVKSFAGLSTMDPGFQNEGLVTLRLELPEEEYEEESQRVVFFDQLLDGMQGALPPQLGSATLASGMVTNLEASIAPLVPEGVPAGDQEDVVFFIRGIAPGYFETLGQPLLQGRDFTADDGLGHEDVAIINQAVVERFFQDTDPVGQRFQMRDDSYRVVGVVGSVQLPGLAQSRFGDWWLYFPYRQKPERGLTIIARLGEGDGTTGVNLIKETVWDIDQSLPIQRVAVVDDLLAESLDEQRSNALLMALFALTALTLGAVGIYGVVAYSVSQRIREIGIRLALGASRRGVVRKMVLGGMKAVLVGVAVGVVGAWVLATQLTTLLHEVSPRDPLVLGAVTVGILAVSLLATWLPARRAASSGPIESLQAD